MELTYQRAGELAFLLDGFGIRHRPVEQETEVVGHQVVGDAHGLPEHLARRFRHADVVADGLAHLDPAVRADEERGRDHALRPLPVVLHDLPAHEQVVELVRTTELDVGVYGDGVVGLHQRIQKLGQGDPVVRREALAEVVPLQDAGYGRRPGQPYQVGHRERGEPLRVVADLRPTTVEDHVSLIEVALRVLLYLSRGEDRTRLRSPGRVADARGVIAYHEYGGVSQVLEGAELLEHDG